MFIQFFLGRRISFSKREVELIQTGLLHTPLWGAVQRQSSTSERSMDVEILWKVCLLRPSRKKGTFNVLVYSGKKPGKTVAGADGKWSRLGL